MIIINFNKDHHANLTIVKTEAQKSDLFLKKMYKQCSNIHLNCS